MNQECPITTTMGGGSAEITRLHGGRSSCRGANFNRPKADIQDNLTHT